MVSTYLNRYSRIKNNNIYKQVLRLRKLGYSYTEIRSETGLAKSTINNWLAHAGLTITKEHLNLNNTNNVRNHAIGTAAAKLTKKKKKNSEINSFIKSAKKYYHDPFFVSGIMLYQAEGAKGSSNGFSNSDYRLIRMYILFLEKYFSLDRSMNLSFRLYIHHTREKDLRRIINFWSKRLKIKPESIKVSWKHNLVSDSRKNINYVGQLYVKVCGIPYFSRKILSVSDIILRQYKKSY